MSNQENQKRYSVIIDKYGELYDHVDETIQFYKDMVKINPENKGFANTLEMCLEFRQKVDELDNIGG